MKAQVESIHPKGGFQTGGNIARPNPPNFTGIQCHKCKGFGHIIKNYPNRRTIIVRDDGTLKEANKDDHNDKYHDGHDDDGDQIPKGEWVMRNMLRTCFLL